MSLNRVLMIVILFGVVPSFATCNVFQKTAAPSREAIVKKAEAKSFWGANPSWLQFTTQKDLIRRVRDRAYGYCLRGSGVDAQCASAQDDAVQSSVMALMVATAQAAMKDKDKLGTKEYYVATNPDIARRVVSSCWALYKEHGAADARILSVCLGNLTDFSPLVPLPVP
jgi:hypothetical protein